MGVLLHRGAAWPAFAAMAALILAGAQPVRAGSSPLSRLPDPAGHDPIGSVQGLVSRLLGASYVDKFAFSTIPDDGGLDVFELSTSGSGKVSVAGNSGVSLASGLYFYLRHYCNVSVTWGKDGSGDNLRMPAALPPLPSPVRRRSLVLYRYAWNVCTVSYSAYPWDWARWERELDWMALHGVNLPLSFTGQEAVWQRLYRELGLTDDEIQAYFSGPAFLAWQRMNNMRGWGGPLSQDWIEGQRQLQHAILARARSFGMWSVLPGFSGRVPSALARVYPNATLIQNRPWGNFNCSTETCNSLLSPTDPLFGSIGTSFYKLLVSEFGTDHVYNADTYNEMEPTSTDPSFLTQSNAAVFDAMRAVDDSSLYVMQGWLFHESFWSDASRVKAYLAGVPDDSMLILDLNTEEQPVWQQYSSFFGKAWVWCLLHNYGGRRGMYGNLTRVATGPVADLAAADSTMSGIGFTPEAIEHNPVIYELLTDMFWEVAPLQVGPWLAGYLRSRYAADSARAVQAWSLLAAPGQPYDQHWDWSAWSVVEHVPQPAPMGTSRHLNATAYVAALRLMVAAAAEGELDASTGPVRYDLVDLARQVAADVAVDVQGLLGALFAAWQGGRAPAGAATTAGAYGSLAARMLDVVGDLDALLGTDPNFLFGVWQQAARGAPNTTTAAEAANQEFNARNQVTLWGPTGQINDYAAKHWAGLVGDYYRTRWALLLASVQAAIANGQSWDADAYGAQLLAAEQQWNAATEAYPTAPSGDALAAAQRILALYADASAATAAFQEAPGTDYPGNDIMQAWTQDVAQLKLLCSWYDWCAGFNSNGWLKNSTQGGSISSPATFWLRTSA